jgi:hypothetical protein
VPCADAAKKLLMRLNNLAFFLELVRSLGFVKVEEQEVPATILSQKQIILVEEERKKIKNNPDYLLDWKEARKSLKPD